MKTNLKQFVVIAVILIFLWLASGLLIWKCVPSQERGMFGDMFGAVNALFSGLALAGIIYTILLQREELSLQREELRLTREEMKRTANAQESADRSFKKQVELMHLSNVMASKASLMNAYAEIILPVYTDIVTNDERKKFVSKLKTRIYEMETMQGELREKEQT